MRTASRIGGSRLSGTAIVQGRTTGSQPRPPASGTGAASCTNPGAAGGTWTGKHEIANKQHRSEQGFPRPGTASSGKQLQELPMRSRGVVHRCEGASKLTSQWHPPSRPLGGLIWVAPSAVQAKPRLTSAPLENKGRTRIWLSSGALVPPTAVGSSVFRTVVPVVHSTVSKDPSNNVE